MFEGQKTLESGPGEEIRMEVLSDQYEITWRWVGERDWITGRTVAGLFPLTSPFGLLGIGKLEGAQRPRIQ